MTKLFLLSFLLLSFKGFSQAPEMKIKGRIVDSTKIKGVEAVMLMAIRTRDSLLLKYARTDAQGNFEMKGFDADTFQLVVAKKGYDDRLLLILGSKENSDLNVGDITLFQGSRELEEVVIFANKNPMYFKGDTLMFIADSFKVKDGAVVEDLLKKLPGVQVQKDGKIKVNGKEVNKVLVDGDEFFGSDAKMATQNLEAKSIENIAVYEEGEAGESGDKTQVLDLRLKDSSKKGYFGKLEGASDFNKFHNGKLTFNKFTSQRKIGAYAIASSVPNSTLGWQDNYQLGFDPGFTFDEDENNWTSNDTYIPDLGSGLPQALRAGLVYNDQLTKKYKFGVSYLFNDTRLIVKQDENTQYLLEDTTYFQTSVLNNTTHDESHTVNITNNIKLDSLTELDINLTANLALKDNKSTNVLDYLSEESVSQRNNSVIQNSDDEKQRLNAVVKLNRNFMKKKRNFKFEYTGTTTDINNFLDNRSENRYISSTSTDSLYRNLNFTVKENKNVGFISYTEPLNRYFSIVLSDRLIYEKSEMNQLNSTLTGASYLLDSTISSSFQTTRVSNLAKALLKFEKKKDMIAFGFGYKNLDRKSQDHFANTGNTLSNGGAAPSFIYRRKINASTQLRFNYDLKRDFPSFDQTQRGVNVSNPNNEVRSNLNLKPSIGHNVSLNYNTHDMLTDQYIYSEIRGGVIKDAIANTVSYDAYGRSISTYANVDGNQFVSGYLGYGRTFFKKWLRFNADGNFNYSVNNSIVNGLANKTAYNNYGVGIDFEHDSDSITVSVGADFSSNGSNSNFDQVARAPQIVQNYSLDLEFKLPFFFNISSDINYSIRTGLSSGYNRNVAIWNIELSNKFKEDGQFEAFVKVMDVLNQNIQISRDFSPTLIIDSKTNVVARYLQVGFVWKFKNKIAPVAK
jgi:hypothetical protein